MKHFSIGHRLPPSLAEPLFGKRALYGLKIQPEDPSWREWQQRSLEFYYCNQRRSIGARVNGAGYRILNHVDLNGKRVLEIGPGEINHLNHWRGNPSAFVIADVSSAMLSLSAAKLKKQGIAHRCALMNKDTLPLPFENRSFDIVLSFYSLEHLVPLFAYLEEFRRILDHGGLLLGAIPTEGGLAWGAGRFVTSRRWLQNNTTIDPDKIICWEHPNFAETILNSLEALFQKQHLDFWPLPLPLIDFNLVIRFAYRK